MADVLYMLPVESERQTISVMMFQFSICLYWMRRFYARTKYGDLSIKKYTCLKGILYQITPYQFQINPCSNSNILGRKVFSISVVTFLVYHKRSKTTYVQYERCWTLYATTRCSCTFAIKWKQLEEEKLLRWMIITNVETDSVVCSYFYLCNLLFNTSFAILLFRYYIYKTSQLIFRVHLIVV